MMTIALAGAMSVLSASAVFAQRGQEQAPRPRGERMEGPGPLRGLFQGITLSAAQQQRVDAILEKYRPEGGRMGPGGVGRGMRGDTAAMRQRREQGPPPAARDTAEMRRRREQGPPPAARDTAEMRRRWEQRQERGDTLAGEGRRGGRPALDPEQIEQMRARREAMIGEVRAVLTPAQRSVFDTNVAAMEKRFENAPRGGGRGERSPARS
jgi:Spy/CpxP family protein refolding chaperone